MKVYFLDIKERLARFGNLESCIFRLRGLRTRKIRILIIISLVIITRLFFSIHFEEKASAKQVETKDKINLKNIDPMAKIRTEEDVKKEKVCAEVMEQKKSAVSEKLDENNNNNDPQDGKIKEILAGYPMERMVEAIGKKDKETAAFLVAIAKKESDWGKHAPRKSGRDCYNYWGYKGSYNLVQGYSCFDSPEQAVEVVGGRIDSLTKKGLHTPERMVVWKCGSSCSWDRPEAVASWIGAVRIYWSKLMIS
jgi:Tfp pilus assembly protein PilP